MMAMGMRLKSATQAKLNSVVLLVTKKIFFNPDNTAYRNFLKI
jgi:hypothetical protein